MNFRFRHLAGVAAFLTGVLMLLGVYTAAAGAGLTCGQRWPLCDGAVFGLFPANWLSFVEWFHRLWAMVTGFVILGATIQAWRTGRSRAVRGAFAVALLVLPTQILLGALTVTQYEWLVLLAHFATATLIYAAVVLGAALAFSEAQSPETVADRALVALTAAAALLPVFALLSPRLLLVYTEAVQVAYYAVGLTVFGGLLAAVAWLRAERTRLVAGFAAFVVAALLVLGRQTYGGSVELATVAAIVAAFALVALARQWAKAETAVGRTTTLFSE